MFVFRLLKALSYKNSLEEIKLVRCKTKGLLLTDVSFRFPQICNANVLVHTAQPAFSKMSESRSLQNYNYKLKRVMKNKKSLRLLEMFWIIHVGVVALSMHKQSHSKDTEIHLNRRS